jgi:Domain of unknown function (DUF4386)
MHESMDDIPRPSPRTIGTIYLLYFVIAFFGLFLLRGLIVPSDAAETANNILSHQALFRAAAAVDLLGNALYIVLTGCLYRLLGPVNWSISLAAAFLSLVGCSVQVFAEIFRLAPLVLLTSVQLGSAFSADQLQSLAMAAFTLHSQSFHISLVLFGLYDVLLGCLVVGSSYIPRPIGVLLICAGVGWLAFLWPPLATALSPAVLSLGALAEIVFMLWLLIRGVDVPKWRHASRTNPERPVA